MKVLSLVLLLVATSAGAQISSGDWQDATLVSFRTIATGSTCSSTGKVNAQADENGNLQGRTSSDTDCSDSTTTLYTVKVGDNLFVVQPTLSGKSTALVAASLGYGWMFVHSPSLHNQLPGARAQIRQQGGHVEIAVGKRHSLYSIVEAR